MKTLEKGKNLPHG